MEILPDELIMIIVSFIDYDDIERICLVNKRLMNIGYNDNLYRLISSHPKLNNMTNIKLYIDTHSIKSYKEMVDILIANYNYDTKCFIEVIFLYYNDYYSYQTIGIINDKNVINYINKLYFVTCKFSHQTRTNNHKYSFALDKYTFENEFNYNIPENYYSDKHKEYMKLKSFDKILYLMRQSRQNDHQMILMR